MFKERFCVCKTVFFINNPDCMFLMTTKRNWICFVSAGPSNICIVQVAMNKWKMQLFHKSCTKNISGFVYNFNAFRDFVTNMFYMVFPSLVFVNENTWEFSYTSSYNFKTVNYKVWFKSFAIRRFSFCEWKSIHFVLVKFRDSLFAFN